MVSASAATNVNGPASSGGAVAELLDMFVEIGCHPADLGLREAVDVGGLDEFIHAAGGDAGEVAVRDHRDQCGFGTLAPLEQRLGEVSAGAELGDRDVDRADPGVEVTETVSVALRRTFRTGPAVLRASDGIRVRGEQGVDHVLEQAVHQIRGRFGQGFTEQAGRVDNVGCGHRDDSVRECCERFTRRITR